MNLITKFFAPAPSPATPAPADGPGLIAVPCLGTIHTKTAEALLRLHFPFGSQHCHMTANTTPAAKRNQVIAQMLRWPQWQWVFFVDSDMVPPPDTLTRLLATGKDVVGALYAGRHRALETGPDMVPPYVPECGPESGDALAPQDIFDQLQAVAWVGAAALLVRRPVLERLAFPWFAAPEVDNEDVGFCAQVRAAGFTVWCDGRVRVPHLQTIPVTMGPTGPVTGVAAPSARQKQLLAGAA